MTTDDPRTLASFRDGIVCESHLEDEPIYTRLYVVRTVDTTCDGDLREVWTHFVPYDELAEFLTEVDKTDEEALLNVSQAKGRPRELSG